MSHQCQAPVKSNKINAEVEIHGFPGLLITYFSVPVGTMSLLPLIYLVWLSEPHATVLRCKQSVYELPEHRDDLEEKSQWDSMSGISLELLRKSWKPGL